MRVPEKLDVPWQSWIVLLVWPRVETERWRVDRDLYGSSDHGTVAVKIHPKLGVVGQPPILDVASRGVDSWRLGIARFRGGNSLPTHDERPQGWLDVFVGGS